MQAGTWVAPVACLALLLAGCLAASPAASGLKFDPRWAEHALVGGEGHDHANATQHLNLSTPNFQVLGHDPMFSPFYGQAAGGTLCGDAAQGPDGRRIAAVESRSKVGFALADVTDGAHPKWLGEVVMENTHVYDVAVVPDGRHVVLVTSGLENLPVRPPVRAEWRTPCAPPVTLELPPSAAPAADPVPRPSSIILVDILDPANPRFVDQQPLSGYGHSAFSTIIGDRTWVLATTSGPYTPAGSGAPPSGYEFFEIASTPAGDRLHLLSIYYPPATPGAVTPAPGPGGHDGWIAVHPATGQTLAYLAGGDRLSILDLADATQPRLLAAWTDNVPGRNVSTGNFHSVVPMTSLVAGRHYTILGPEFATHPVDIPSGIVWVLDTTDPERPREVAGWTLPVDVEWAAGQDYQFSTHYLGVHDETLFVSMYHGGVWAVDLSPIGSAPFVSLPSIGVFLAADPGAEPAEPVRWAPTSEEVLPFADGNLVTFDPYSGLWVFRFDDARPAPPPTPWPIVPPHPAGAA
jgi:hypothetical protein